MKYILLFCSILWSTFSFAQMTVTANSNAAQLAQYLAGPGVTISNAVLNCPTGGAGYFNSASTGLGISDGVLLTNGLISDAANANTFFASTSHAGTGDSDLDAILAQAALVTTDVCVLEFDITVTGDSLNFSYVFGSEEYNGFVCNGFNDVFAFFISGPNPNGGVYTAQNVALIPGTNTPVSINTVNDGNPDGFDPGCQSFNTQYYNATPLADVSYDGRTQKLTAQAEVVPCATYHFKLAVGDGSPQFSSDDVFDSGVFLEEGSFSSNAVAVGASSVLGGSYNYLIEGCLEGVFTFDIFTNGGSSDTIIDFILGGSAVNGVDYQFIDEQLIFDGNDTSVSISIIPIQDNILEGTEQIVLYLTSQGCNSSITDSAVIEINDNIAVSTTPTADSLCNGDSVLIVATGADSYSWGPPNAVSNLTDSFTYASPSSSTLIELYTSLGSCVDTTYIPVTVGNLDAVLPISTDESCPGEQDGSAFFVIDTAVGMVSYLWSTGDTTSGVDSLGAGVYSVTVSDQSGCVIGFNFQIDAPTLFVDASATDSVICLGNTTQFNVVDSFMNASYLWQPSTGLSSDTIVNPIASPTQSTQYVLTATVNGDCEISDSVNIVVQNLEVAPIYTDTIVQAGTVLDVGVIVTDSTNLTGPIVYNWVPIDYLNQINLSQTQATVFDNIVYNIYVESNGCLDTAQIVIATDINYNIPNAFTPNNDGLNDVFQIVNLTGGIIREMKIYNQWGNLVHNSPQPWDGTYQGLLQPMGVYNYYIRFVNIGQEVIESGQFTMIY